MNNCYELLGLDKRDIKKLDSGSKEDIELADSKIAKAYKLRAKLVHPDLNPDDPNANEKFDNIRKAYNKLKSKELRDAYEHEKDQTNSLSAIRYKVDVFIELISALAKYNPKRKNQFIAILENISEKYVTLSVIDYELDKIKLKRGTFVSLRAFGVDTEGESLENFTMSGMIKLVMNNTVKIAVVKKRNAILKRGMKAVLGIDESTRFLFENIKRNMQRIIDEKKKYVNFRNLIAYVYNNARLPLNTIGLEEVENTPLPRYLREAEVEGFKYNEEQKELINKALDLFEKNQAYTLACSGPGGTGKTECVVEIIRQCLYRKNNSRILVASHTNVAVDNVFVKLISDLSLTRRIVRVAAEHRIKLKEVKKVSLDAQLGISESRVCALEKFNVMGVTLDKLATSMFDNFDFDLAILDEASMIEFPKIMVVASKAKKLILIGDEHQLQPFLDDKVINYLKTLNFDDEKIKLAQSSFFTKLVRYLNSVKSNNIVYLKEQRRAYPEIIRFSNKNWYKDLRTVVTERLENRLQLYSGLKNSGIKYELVRKILDPNKKLVWVETQSMADEFKFSSNKDWHIKFPDKYLKYFNTGNAAIIILILETLLNYLRDTLKNESQFDYRKKCGIISPFNSQIDLLHKYLYLNPHTDPYLRNLLTKKLNPIDEDLLEIEKFMFTDTLEMGSVHKFQGREKDIIIFDITSFTGARDAKLLKDYRVLNVALTRARCKVIIVGTVRDTTPHYSDLHSVEFVHFVGLKQNEADLKKLKRLEFMKRLGAKMEVEFSGSCDTLNLSDYFSRDQNLKRRYLEIYESLNKIEGYLRDHSHDDLLFSSEDEYDYKTDQIFGLIKLDNLISGLMERLSDKKEIILSMKPEIINYIKNFVINNYLSSEITVLLREKLDYLDSQFELLADLFSKVKGIKPEEDQIPVLEKIKRRFKEESIPDYLIQSRIDELKRDLECAAYQKKIEEKYDVKFEGVKQIISNNISKDKLKELLELLEAMPSTEFPSYGKQLCRIVLEGKPLDYKRHPIQWLDRLLTNSPPKSWNSVLWLALKIRLGHTCKE